MEINSAALKYNFSGEPVINKIQIDLPYPDRHTAGRVLSQALEAYRHKKNTIVLALPRGGVPVAKEIASTLGLPLDILLVRKIGVSGHEELAMGAVASNDVIVWNEAVLKRVNINNREIEYAIQNARNELKRREKAYRGDRSDIQLENRCVILVDDGLATGSSMQAAVDAVRLQNPARIVVAVPIAPPDTVASLRKSADEVICLATPEPFYSVGDWYLDFSQLSDAAVSLLLEAAYAEEINQSKG